MKKLLVGIFIAATVFSNFCINAFAFVGTSSAEVTSLVARMHEDVLQKGGKGAVEAFKSCVQQISARSDDEPFYSSYGESETDAGICVWTSIKKGNVTYAAAETAGELTYTVSVEEDGYTYAYSISYKKETGEYAEYETKHYLDGTVERIS